MTYPLTFYVDSLPDGFAGMANGPVIRILKSHKDDVGLYQHELEHVKQWFRTLGIHPILYFFSDTYKLWSEVRAYKKQAACYPDDRKPRFARFIATKYNLSITEADALEKLR
jgi:hypothetical protein